VGIIDDPEFELEGIKADSFSGKFFVSRKDELKRYCVANPRYHIISILRPAVITVNACVEKALFYMLGDGDKNPNLILLDTMKPDDLADLKIMEFDMEARFAQAQEIEHRGNARPRFRLVQKPRRE